MLLLLLISFASSVNAFDYYRRCLLYKGMCVPHCPKNMHPYHTRCDKDTYSQRTCDSEEQFKLGYTCGWSRCDCNGDLVLNEVDGTCIPIPQCPLDTYKDRKRGARKLKRKDKPKLKKKFRPRKEELPEMN